MGIKDIKTKEELDRELRSGGNRFLLFYSAWDLICVDFIPAFEKLADGNAGSFCKVSIDNLKEVADIFSIEVVPTVLFFRGDKLDKRLDGIPDKGLTAESLAEFIWRCRGIVSK